MPLKENNQNSVNGAWATLVDDVSPYGGYHS